MSCSDEGKTAESWMKSVDYSDRAITQRIRQVSQLRKLCLSLAKATKPVQSAADPPPSKR
jgi:hypothetical protein